MRARLFIAAAFVGLFPACVTGPPKLAPVPDRVESLEGFGSISVRGGEVTAKSRFAFAFRHPDLGRVEALDMFGRTTAILIFKEGTACLILPSKGVYWSGPEGDLMIKFLGFRLRAAELSAMIGGTWDRLPAGDAPPDGDWSIKKDPRGRAVEGNREGVRFETTEFFRGSSAPRTIAFTGPESSGRVRVLKIQFNRPPHGDPFGLASLQGLREKTWPEIEAYLRNED